VAPPPPPPPPPGGAVGSAVGEAVGEALGDGDGLGVGTVPLALTKKRPVMPAWIWQRNRYGVSRAAKLRGP
jgi:hypothetical protein